MKLESSGIVNRVSGRVALKFCEVPYNTDVENRADLVEFKSFNEKNSKKLNKRNQTPVGVVDTETALKYVGVVIWRKLYARELFSKIRFPAGMVYEDMAVSHKLIFEAKRIVMIDDVLYFHVYRKGSITNTRSVKNSRDAFISTFRRVEDMNSYGLLLENVNFQSFCATSDGL